MGKLADRAVRNHKSFYSCSGAVLCAFHESTGLSESEAQRKVAPFASGRAGKCGAVMVLSREQVPVLDGKRHMPSHNRRDAIVDP